MAYAIIRVGKMKSASAISGQSDHVERERLTPNADAERLALNQRLAGTGDAWADVQARFEECKITPQKNAVLAIDVFISASPEYFASNHPDDPAWKAFQAKAMEFLREEYGKENIVHAVAHHDETSPHLHAIITPINTKIIKVGRKVKTEKMVDRLCARDWLGGDRTTLSKLQTRFADKVANLGLKRGVEGSRATHTEVKKFYTIMNEVVSTKTQIDGRLSPINVDQAVLSVDKPGFGVLTPHAYAQAQVRAALERVQAQIDTTNGISQQLRQGLTVQLQAPAIEALQEKAATRQSQAEAALEKLGYRLDQHGGLVDILEERKNALRTTISNCVKDSTSYDELRPLLKERGLTLGFDKTKQETVDGKNLNGAYFLDKKGRIDGKDLGPDFTTAALRKLLAANAKRKEEKEQAAAKAATEKAEQAKLKAQAKQPAETSKTVTRGRKMG